MGSPNTASSPGPPIPEDSISIVLFSRGDKSFHWAIGLSIPECSHSFRKLHATQLIGPGWEFEDTVHDIGALQLRKPVCAVVQIGRMANVHNVERIASTLRSVPLELTGHETQDSVFTCRTWVRETLRVLHDEGSITCSDVDALEKVLVHLGTANDDSTVMGGHYQVHEWHKL